MLRNIGSLLRGTATPFQVMAACVLGAMLGFVPGVAQGAGLTLVLLMLLVVLNANLGVAALAGLAGKALSLALLPVSFATGRALMDGPAQGIFRAIINAPVLALFGFDYYATTGGAVLGLVCGVAMGAGLCALIGAFRKRMAAMEESSPRFIEFSRRWWARVLVFLLLGRGHGRATYAQLLQQRVGKPIRTSGAALAVLVAIAIVIVFQFASAPIVTAWLKAGLERANGATVDLERATLDLASGRLTVEGLAMADPNDLGTDLLHAARLEADVSATDLLRKRVAIDRLEVVDAQNGQPRRFPGRLVGPPPRPAGETGLRLPDGRELEAYLRDAARWKERLAQARRWLEPVARGEAQPGKETLEQRLARQVSQHGYSRVRAEQLIEGAPTFAVYELLVQGVRSASLVGETLTVRGENLSTQPWLLERPPRLAVSSSKGTLELDARLGAEADGTGRIELHFRNLSGDEVGQALAVGGTPPFSGGTIDVDSSGRLDGGSVDLPLRVTLRRCTLSLPGAAAQAVESLVVTLAVRGPLDDPRVLLDEEALARALAEAGASKLAERLRGEGASALEKAAGEAPEGLRDQLKGILGRDRKP
jgi:uncharacterized protein (TIGR03546 family)